LLARIPTADEVGKHAITTVIIQVLFLKCLELYINSIWRYSVIG